MNYKYTSSYTLTHLYTIDHSRITGYLRNYDPIKQNYCLLPYNDIPRPTIVPKKYLIHFDDFLLPCNVSTFSAKPLTVIKHLVSAPLSNTENLSFTALSKQAYSYNELLFISAIIAFMVKAEAARSDTQYITPEQYTPKQQTITTDKLNDVLVPRTLRDITYKLDPYKKHPRDSPLAILTHILECYHHTLNIIHSLDIDSQRITQSSKTIQTTLNTFNIVFCSSNPM